MSAFVAITLASLLGLAMIQTVAFAVGRSIGRYNVADVVWGIGFVAVAWISLLLAHQDNPRTWLIALVVTVWGVRLSWHVHRASAGKGEDPRYTEMLDRSGGATVAVVVRKIFLTQLVAQWFISLPIQVSAAAGPTTGAAGAALAGLGLLLAAAGIAFEAIGDRQMRDFKADPNRGSIMDRGLWGWSRHPNYFGDACLWWGVWLIAASAWPGVLTILSPAAMTYLLVYGTGARLLERTMSKRSGWAEYAARTSFFVPQPPRRGRSQ